MIHMWPSEKRARIHLLWPGEELCGTCHGSGYIPLTAAISGPEELCWVCNGFGKYLVR